MLVFITGFMGAGKSSFARMAALQFQKPLYDSDAILAERYGQAVAEQISADIDRFRDREALLVMELACMADGIISLGGGAVENADTLARLKGKPVVFLDPGVDVCWQRVQASTQLRPLAADYESFVQLYNKRLPLYLSICRWRLTDNLPPEQLLLKLEPLINQG